MYDTLGQVGMERTLGPATEEHRFQGHINPGKDPTWQLVKLAHHVSEVVCHKPVSQSGDKII